MRGHTSGKLAASIMALCGCAAGAAAQTAWLSPVNGLWSDPANWTAGVPNSGGVTATVGHAGAYTVQQNGSYTVGVLSVTNPAATVAIDPGQTLSVTSGLSNAGTVVVNRVAVNSTAQIFLLGSAAFTGTGRVTLNANSNNNDSARIVRGSGGITLTNGAGHTIDGTGHINGVPFDNQGLIDANVSGRVLAALNLSATNTGTMRATGGGELHLNSATISQSGAGQILASGGRVRLQTATINAGVIGASGG